jgi:uncharacterized protein
MGRVIHFEIHASDPAACARWYGDNFGWTCTLVMPALNYWSVATGPGDGIDGGIVQRMGASPAAGAPVSAFICTIQVENVDEQMAKVQAAGAQEALPKFPVPGVGWMAYFIDPFGNLVGLMQEDPTAPSGGPPLEAAP